MGRGSPFSCLLPGGAGETTPATPCPSQLVQLSLFLALTQPSCFHPGTVRKAVAADEEGREGGRKVDVFLSMEGKEGILICFGDF